MPKQQVAVELFYDAAWHDLAANDDVFADGPIVIKRGQSDEAASLRPCSISCTLANDDDRYRTSNPQSPIYGKAGRNTPMRVSVGGTVRAVVEASSWAAGQTPDFRVSPRRGRAWVDVEGGGILQRIGQWSKQLPSPFRYHNDQLSHVTGYWPLEQARGSTKLFSPTPGTFNDRLLPNGISNVAFDSQYRPLGSGPLMDIGSDPSEAGSYFARTTASSTSGWQLSWAVRHGPLVAGDNLVFAWATTDGSQWSLFLNTTSKTIDTFASVNPLTGVGASYTHPISYGSYDWSQWTLISIDAVYSGGSTTINVNWTNADRSAGGFNTGSYAGVPSVLDWWDASTGDGIPAGSTLGHVIGTDVSHTGVDLFGGDRLDAWTGHIGERASYRFGRLCDQLGVPYYVSPSFDLSAPMGPQAVDTFPNLLKEIQDTDDGLIFDYVSELRLYFRSRADRYNRTPLALIPADLPALPDEVTDDLNPHNVITVSQRDGGEYTVSDTTGPLGTQNPPNGIGEYRQTKNVCVANETTGLPPLANWWLKRGTVNLPRYPQLTINLAALAPARIAQIEAVDVGSVITITGFREYTVRLQVLGWTETIGTHTRTITFTCAPDQQFQVGVWDSTSSRWDSATHFLETGVSSSATSLTFRSLSSKVTWSTATPYDVIISGEQLTVTSMGAAALVSGGYDQAATVTRSVNGVSKSLSANEPIHAATPGRWAL
ncbi:hypothetical protein [Actinoplanes subtropicus]|uniref:hypothetical protein n=1 Tax=Actinoplanes subtropicus TaxID=543632 RepID=UPI0012FBE791|nr:hypothetical protein [Actinoplanes subtropicus]